MCYNNNGFSHFINAVVAGNGISKVYVATPYSNTVYKKGMPVFVYRIFGGEGKMYKSVVTSYCTITSIDVVKENGFFNAHPYKIVYNKKEFEEILKLGDVDVQNTLID